MRISKTSALTGAVFELATTNGQVTGASAADDGLLRWLLVEDASWKLAHDAWRSTRPRWWRRDHRRRWRREGTALRDDRQRIAGWARRCGVAH